MDNIPFRSSGANNRAGHSAATGGESVESSAERPQHRAPSHHAASDQSNKKKLIIAAVAALIVLIVGVAIYFVSSSDGTASAIDGSKYQAIFFTNGQVYFGKLHTFNNGYFKLTKIFYLQAQQSETTGNQKNPQQTNNDQNANVQLIKLGNEIHGPADEMVISKDQVLFFENLKADGKVSQSISKYQSTNK